MLRGNIVDYRASSSSEQSCTVRAEFDHRWEVHRKIGNRPSLRYVPDRNSVHPIGRGEQTSIVGNSKARAHCVTQTQHGVLRVIQIPDCDLALGIAHCQRSAVAAQCHLGRNAAHVAGPGSIKSLNLLGHRCCTSFQAGLGFVPPSRWPPPQPTIANAIMPRQKAPMTRRICPSMLYRTHCMTSWMVNPARPLPTREYRSRRKRSQTNYST